MITTKSSNSFRNRKIYELYALLESLNLTAPPLERDFSYLEGDIRFVKLFKEYEIGDLSEEETEEEEEVVEVEELGVEYFDKFMTKDELAYHKIRGMHIFIENLTYIVDFLIIEDISLFIDPCLSQVVLGEPFVETSNMTYDSSLGIVKFTNGVDEVAYRMPHKIEQIRSLSNMEKEHKQSVYFRNKDDIKRGVVYVMEKIFGFYKE
ncbi:hypothetical protein Tco_0891816 [Tanacetum coccineum]|uniref:MAK10-like protein n=1 Tax=Tanacetum coccineum TaxID=301880 RepID=A0ABQ5CA46_9ASTR